VDGCLRYRRDRHHRCDAVRAVQGGVTGAIQAGGGRFLVRGGELAVLEGDWQPSRLVVLEFEDLAAARDWYESEVYQQAKKLRDGAARLRMVAVQGVD
jgi:uncharacterized protein (DUF1330 family)